MDAREFLEILHTAERLKDTLRHCTTLMTLRKEILNDTLNKIENENRNKADDKANENVAGGNET